MTARDELRAAKALQGVEFPATKDELIEYASVRGAGEKTLQALRTMPERRFENKEQVVEAVPQEPEGDAPGGTDR